MSFVVHSLLSADVDLALEGLQSRELPLCSCTENGMLEKSIRKLSIPKLTAEKTAKSLVVPLAVKLVIRLFESFRNLGKGDL